MKTLTLIAVLMLLVACSASPAETPIAPVTKSTDTSTPPPTLETPASSSTPPASGATRPPPTSGTTSSEPISDKKECVVKGDCVAYVEKGMPGELCAHYDDVGCYHHYACNPMGEVVQKETPAFCGR